MVVTGRRHLPVAVDRTCIGQSVSFKIYITSRRLSSKEESRILNHMPRDPQRLLILTAHHHHFSTLWPCPFGLAVVYPGGDLLRIAGIQRGEARKGSIQQPLIRQLNDSPIDIPKLGFPLPHGSARDMLRLHKYCEFDPGIYILR